MKQKYNVIRPHIGDQHYKKGDTRVADPRRVKHLIGTCLEDPEAAKKPAKGKAAPKAKNKAEPKANNKAEPKAENKTDPEAKTEQASDGQTGKTND